MKLNKTAFKQKLVITNQYKPSTTNNANNNKSSEKRVFFEKIERKNTEHKAKSIDKQN